MTNPDDRSDILPERLRSIAKAYPEDIFGPVTEAEVREHSSLITRNSAAMGRHLGQFMLEAADEIERLKGALSETQELLETERLRLAACSTAALGYFDGCHEDYKSAALGDVLDVRKRLEEHARKLRESTDYAEAAFQAWEAFQSDFFKYADLDKEHGGAWIITDANYEKLRRAMCAAFANRRTEIRQRERDDNHHGCWQYGSANPVHAVGTGFPNIREWCRGSPTSIVITFVDDITSEQMEAIPTALMDALYRRHSQVSKQEPKA